jgi:hypothetical protein
MKILLLSGTMAALVIGLLCSSPALAQTPPQTGEKVSPEEAKQHKDWNESMLKKPAPKQGCFKADYPSTDWKEVKCVAPPKHPALPRNGPRPGVVGNSNDISAQAPSGHISRAIGAFDTVSGVTSESSPLGDPTGTPVTDAYTLQMNTDRFSSAVCTGSPSAVCNGPANTGCCGWQQFVFFNNGSPGPTGTLVIQDWILRYNATCPAGQGWTQFSFTGSTDIYCWQNVKTSDPTDQGATPVDNQPISNLANLRMSTSVSSTGDSVILSTGGTTTYNRTVSSKVNASAGWTAAEFNILGYGGDSNGGTTASFNTGVSINTRTEIIYGGTAAPNCVAEGFTAEMNNLSFGPTAPAATMPGPAIIFIESIAGGATSNCNAAASIGDTHLATFNGLFYDFQASGDFVLAQVDPSFTVQTRQASGAPQWPNAAVNKAVAARIGNTQVAVCLAPPANDQALGAAQQARLVVDGKDTPLDDGKSLSLTGADVLRQGNVYFITSDEGDSVRAEVNPTWINVNVGLGHWPAAVHGLIANANGNVNQIETRDHFVLNNPFQYEELYHRYADSWRVPAEASMLSVCGGREIERGIPTGPFYAGDLEPGLRTRARGVCNTADVKPGPLLEACTLDVAVIGDDGAAKVFVNANPPVAVGTIVGGTPGRGGGGILGLPWWVWLLILLLIIIVIILIVTIR